MWNGTTPSLKAMPATTNTRPKASSCRSVSLDSTASLPATSLRVSVPVAP